MEKEPIGFKFLAPADRFMSKHRFAIVIGTLAIALAGTPLLSKLRFVFNPLDLSPPKAEAVVTLRDLMKHPETDPNTISILAPSLTDAQPVSERLRQLPQVARVTTLENFVPGDQDAKLAIIHAARVLKPVLDPSHRPSPPSDAEDVEAMGRAAQTLIRAAANASGKGVDDARHVALLIWKLAVAPPEVREAARQTLLPSLETTLDLSRASLNAHKVTVSSIPSSLAHNWVIPDGGVRIEVAPKGDPNDDANFVRFGEAVRKIAPKASP